MENNAFIFRVKQSNCLTMKMKMKTTGTLQNARNYLPSDTMCHPRRLETSATPV
jgi:hypothetical protein